MSDALDPLPLLKHLSEYRVEHIVPVHVCGLEHLRLMKRAAGRPQDLEDLKRLDCD
jgi:hypothetical protein